MTKFLRPFSLSVIIVLILASCSLFSTPTTNTQPPLQIIQPTPSLAELINLELAVQADTSVPFNTEGQLIKFSYTIKITKNSSSDVPANITVNGAAVTCPEIKTVGNLDDRLDQGEIIVCKSDYVITKADLDKGSVTNVSTANVYSVNSNTVTTTLPTLRPVALTLAKTANPVSFDRVNQPITYNYVITNSGSTALGPTQFTVTDTGFPSPINCGEGTVTLAPNATVTCAATYTITQANMDSGSVSTSATAAGGGLTPSQPVSVTITKSSVVQSNPSNLTAGTTIKHQVASGEWLWQIARCYGADPSKTLQANPQLSNPGQISPNTTVSVPNIGSAGKIYGPPCITTYITLSGDTWTSIAQKYNADPAVLQKVNSNNLTVGKTLIVPLNSAGGGTAAVVPPVVSTGNCVDLSRTIKFIGINPAITHFSICGVLDGTGNMKISTIKIFQRPEDVGLGGFGQDIAVSLATSTPLNDPNSLIIGDMNYDGNDDFRIVRNLPAGPNIPYLYYIYDQPSAKFNYNSAYENITSPEFPGNSEIRSKWRESAVKWGIDTYTITNNIPKLTRKETWEAINATQATHRVITYDANGIGLTAVDETIPIPVQP